MLQISYVLRVVFVAAGVLAGARAAEPLTVRLIGVRALPARQTVAGTRVGGLSGIDYDAAAGRFSVWNDGEAIPVVVHKTEGIYVPELIFGVVLTSSNYAEGARRTTGGRHDHLAE